ncbi:hypothetical protein RB200_06800 [Streptomyces sp. PmtG]
MSTGTRSPTPRLREGRVGPRRRGGLAVLTDPGRADTEHAGLGRQWEQLLRGTTALHAGQVPGPIAALLSLQA